MGAAVAGRFGSRKNCAGKEPDRDGRDCRATLSPLCRKAERIAATPGQEATSEPTPATASAVAERLWLVPRAFYSATAGAPAILDQERNSPDRLVPL